MNKENIISLKRKISNKWFETKDAMLDEILNVIDYLQHQLEEKDKVINEVKKYCKFKSKFNCFGDSLTEKAINTYVNATKKDILEILERGKNEKS